MFKNFIFLLGIINFLYSQNIKDKILEKIKIFYQILFHTINFKKEMVFHE